MLAALDLIEPGDALVITTQTFTGTAMIGDNVAKRRSAVAIVTEGVVRDVAEILAIGLPVFCRGATPATCFTNGPGEVGLPIAIGEVSVRAGDFVAGDRDGVLIVARERIGCRRWPRRRRRCNARSPTARSARCSTSGGGRRTRSPTSTESAGRPAP